jgi:hypothetical protein
MGIHGQTGRAGCRCRPAQVPRELRPR